MSHQTLYRKYRPKSFAEVTGQEHVTLTVEHQIAAGSVAHAYLFTGPRGVGKTTTARLFAAAVNGASGADAEPIFEGHDLDVIEIDAASHSGVDMVREVIVDSARFMPNFRKYKVFIIDEVHMLSTAAFNALLKTLEEPPTHAIFILATTELHKVPATIVSRCQRFDFKRIRPDAMAQRLSRIATSEEVSVDGDVLTEIARRSEGCLRDAESLLGQILSLGERRVTMETATIVLPSTNVGQVITWLEDMRARNAESAIAHLNAFVDEGVDVIQFAADAIEIARRMLVHRTQSGMTGVLEVGGGRDQDLLRLAESFSLSDLVNLIDLLNKKRLDIRQAVVPQLPLELAAVEFSLTGGGPRVAEEPRNAPPSVNSGPVSRPDDEAAHGKAREERPSAPKKPATPTALTLDGIKAQWGSFVILLQAHNPSLVLVLKTAEPLAWDAGILTVGFKYSFHKQRMDQAPHADAAASVFEQCFHEPCRFANNLLPADYVSDFIAQSTRHDEVELLADALVSKQTPSEHAPVLSGTGSQEDLIKNLVRAFGGSVSE